MRLRSVDRRTAIVLDLSDYIKEYLIFRLVNDDQPLTDMYLVKLIEDFKSDFEIVCDPSLDEDISELDDGIIKLMIRVHELIRMSIASSPVYGDGTVKAFDYIPGSSLLIVNVGE